MYNDWTCEPGFPSPSCKPKPLNATSPYPWDVEYICDDEWDTSYVDTFPDEYVCEARVTTANYINKSGEVVYMKIAPYTNTGVAKISDVYSFWCTYPPETP